MSTAVPVVSYRAVALFVTFRMEAWKFGRKFFIVFRLGSFGALEPCNQNLETLQLRNSRTKFLLLYVICAWNYIQYVF